jgi:23S rRNA pseudouridine2605 synthase
MTAPDRLNRYLALGLGISRREADELISDRRVSIDGVVAELGARIPEGATVTVNDKAVHLQDYQYLAFHKPSGYVCSRRRQGETPTIYELIPEEYHALKPVGRLDKDSSGLILLTNDGDFTQQMTHPSYYKTKVYEVSLDRDLQPLHQQMISDYGITLEDGKSKFMIERLETEGKSQLYRVTMAEGRNRQIRRTFAALGYTVTALHRQVFGRFTLGDLKSGEYTPLVITDSGK